MDVGDYTAYLWRSCLFAGYTPSELRELARRGLSKVIGRGRMWRDVNVPKEKRGMVFAPEIKELFRELRKAGIAVYIVSGSFQEQLFAATGPEFGLDIDPACVFGAELKKDASGRYFAGDGGGVRQVWREALFYPRAHRASPPWCRADPDGRRLDGRLYDAYRVQGSPARACLCPELEAAGDEGSCRERRTRCRAGARRIAWLLHTRTAMRRAMIPVFRNDASHVAGWRHGVDLTRYIGFRNEKKR